jgi:hypothetical protein
MFRLRIWSKDFKEIDTIDHRLASHLLDIGKVLQKEFGAYFRLEYTYIKEVTQ